MAKDYSNKGSKISKATIDDATHKAIGQIIRCVADVEDLLTFYFMSLTNTNESQALAILGVMNIGAKIEKCAALAVLKGEKHKEEHDTTFNQTWRDFLLLRNVLAHSRLLGMTHEGALAFLVAKDPLPNIGNADLYNVACYSPKGIRQWVPIGLQFPPAMRRNLQLQPWLETSPRRELGPHPKAPKKRPSKKAKQPPH